MGHRKLIFRQRISRKEIKSSIEQSLNEKDFKRTVQIAITHYTTRTTGLDFATAILATSEAQAIAKDLKWSRSLEDMANMAISVAESRTDKRLSEFRRKTVLEQVVNTLQKLREESKSVK